MLKSYKQQRIEARHAGRDIKEILMELLEANKGSRNITTIVGAELAVSDETIGNWCREHGINLNDYRSRESNTLTSQQPHRREP